MNLLLLEPHELDVDGRVILREARHRHLRDVLRVAAGDRVRVGLVEGPVGAAEVESHDAESTTLRCILDGEPPARPPVDLLLALPRPKVMNRLWAQLAALGVDRILLTRAARVERTYFETHVLRPDHYLPLLREGLQQACATRLPRVSIHTRFRPFIEDELGALSDAETRLLAHPGERRADALPSGGRVLLAVGPEGGWVPFELDLLRQRGFQPFQLGLRPLRTDTACIALLAVVQARLAGPG